MACPVKTQQIPIWLKSPNATVQLGRVKEFIDSQISNDVTISDLAAVAGLSQFHFIRAFKGTIALSIRPIGAGPSRKSTVVQTRSIDCQRGARGRFHDALQLNRVFRKFVGVTPTAFRRENWLDQPLCGSVLVVGIRAVPEQIPDCRRRHSTAQGHELAAASQRDLLVELTAPAKVRCDISPGKRAGQPRLLAEQALRHWRTRKGG